MHILSHVCNSVYYGKILLVIRQKREEGIDIGQTNHAGLHGVIRKLSTSLARALMWFTGPTPPAPCFRIILARITIYLFDIGVSSSPHTPTRSPTTFITMHPWSYYEGRPSWHTHSSRTNTNITPYVYVFIIDTSVCTRFCFLKRKRGYLFQSMIMIVSKKINSHFKWIYVYQDNFIYSFYFYSRIIFKMIYSKIIKSVTHHPSALVNVNPKRGSLSTDTLMPTIPIPCSVTTWPRITATRLLQIKNISKSFEIGSYRWSVEPRNADLKSFQIILWSI